MATFKAGVDLNFVYRPTLAPLREQAVEVSAFPGEKRGLPALAGGPIHVPDHLAFAVDFDLRSSGLIPGFEWIEVPDLDTLLEQRALVQQFAADNHFARLDAE